MSPSDKQPHHVNQNQTHMNVLPINESKMDKTSLWISGKTKSSYHKDIDRESPYNVKLQHFRRKGTRGKLYPLQRIGTKINNMSLEKPDHIADSEVWEQMKKYFPFVS